MMKIVEFNTQQHNEYKNLVASHYETRKKEISYELNDLLALGMSASFALKKLDMLFSKQNIDRLRLYKYHNTKVYRYSVTSRGKDTVICHKINRHLAVEPIIRPLVNGYELLIEMTDPKDPEFAPLTYKVAMFTEKPKGKDFGFIPFIKKSGVPVFFLETLLNKITHHYHRNNEAVPRDLKVVHLLEKLGATKESVAVEGIEMNEVQVELKIGTSQYTSVYDKIKQNLFIINQAGVKVF